MHGEAWCAGKRKCSTSCPKRKKKSDGEDEPNKSSEAKWACHTSTLEFETDDDTPEFDMQNDWTMRENGVFRLVGWKSGMDQ